MQSLKFKLVTSLKEAEKIWKALSPDEKITDDWDFRYAYYKYFNYPLYFYTAYQGDKPVAVLPLQKNTDKGYLEFFGGGYMEDNQVFNKTNSNKVVKKLIDQVEKPANLAWMNKPLGINNEKIEEYKYVLNLDGIKSLDDYVQTNWVGKSKKNLKAQVKKLESLGVEVILDNTEDFNDMVKLNKKRFGKESIFYLPHRADFLKDAGNLFESHTITIYVDGKKQSVGFAFKYKDTYIGANSGTNPKINGLGKFLSLQKIQQAINVGAKFYDARAGDLGWKKAFKFTEIPQYFAYLK